MKYELFQRIALAQGLPEKRLRTGGCRNHR